MRTGIDPPFKHKAGHERRVTSVNLDSNLIDMARHRDMIRPGRVSDLVNTALRDFIDDYDRVKKEAAERKVATARKIAAALQKRHYRRRTVQNVSIYQGILPHEDTNLPRVTERRTPARKRTPGVDGRDEGDKLAPQAWGECFKTAGPTG